MSNPDPAFRFNVDLTNPGHFLACCGLLELAHRADAAATAWFTDQEFCIATCPRDLIPRLLDSSIEAVSAPNTETENDEDDGGRKSPPILIADFALRLDWWTDPSAVRAGFKTWSGGQTVLGFVEGMRRRIRSDCEVGPDLLTGIFAIGDPKPFYFDSHLARLTAIDAGFSTEKFTTPFSPAVELLAMIGLQRFRPITVEPREQYAFATWDMPLPANIAAPVAHGLVPSLVSQHFQFPLVVRTGGKYKAFGPATSTWRIHARPTQAI